MAESFEPFYIIRHGVTQANVAGWVSSRSETPLTPEGVQQAQQAGKVVAGLGLKRLFCSPMGRARATAEALGLGLEPLVDEGVLEVNFGDYEGKPFSAWQTSGLSVVGLWQDRKTKIPGGESFDEVFARGMDFIRRNFAVGSPTSLVVSHGGFIKMLLLGLYPQLSESLLKRGVGNCELFKISPEGFQSLWQAPVVAQK